MAEKEYKTIDEQIELLKSRGLTIGDEEKAKDFLYRNNYYRVSGYSLTLRNHDVFHKNAEFDNIIDIYNFDHELRHTLLKYIEIIEVTVKSIFAHEFTKVHGPVGYLDSNVFLDADIYDRVMKKADEQKGTRLPHEPYLQHFRDENQELPLWAFVDLLTISDISFLYSITEKPIQKCVADAMGITSKGPVLMKRFMHDMTIIRNLCAHGNRLYNRKFQHKASVNKADQNLLMTDKNGGKDMTRLYGYILVMKRLLKPEEFGAMKSEIENIEKKYPFVNLKYYGIRADWKIVL